MNIFEDCHTVHRRTTWPCGCEVRSRNLTGPSVPMNARNETGVQGFLCPTHGDGEWRHASFAGTTEAIEWIGLPERGTINNESGTLEQLTTYHPIFAR